MITLSFAQYFFFVMTGSLGAHAVGAQEKPERAGGGRAEAQ